MSDVGFVSTREISIMLSTVDLLPPEITGNIVLTAWVCMILWAIERK
jgi:hypothetical protein